MVSKTIDFHIKVYEYLKLFTQLKQRKNIIFLLLISELIFTMTRCILYVKIKFNY